jgi:hypothetical protein
MSRSRWSHSLVTNISRTNSVRFLLVGLDEGVKFTKEMWKNERNFSLTFRMLLPA